MTTCVEDFVTCPSQKVRYASSRDARQDIKALMSGGSKARRNYRRPHVYNCYRCGGWHLTTKWRR